MLTSVLHQLLKYHGNGSPCHNSAAHQYATAEAQLMVLVHNSKAQALEMLFNPRDIPRFILHLCTNRGMTRRITVG